MVSESTPIRLTGSKSAGDIPPRAFMSESALRETRTEQFGISDYASPRILHQTPPPPPPPPHRPHSPHRPRSSRFRPSLIRSPTFEYNSSDDFFYSSEDDPNISDTDSVEGFPFHTPSINESDIETIEEITTNEKTEFGSHARCLQDSASQDVYSFEFSQYHEEENDGLEIHASFVHRPLSKGAATRAQPIFQWMHLKPTVMDFEAFSKTVSGLPNLSGSEVDEIRRLLQRVQKKAERPLRAKEGPKGRVMEPILCYNSQKDEKLDATSRVIFCHFPFFSLEMYSPTSWTQNHLHPPRALISSRYPSTSRNQELRQAVCHLAGIPTDHCFHLSGLWCLTIKDKYIVTCSRQLSASQIHGDLVSIEKCPPSDQSLDPMAGVKVLQMMFEEVLYLIPLDQCKTWFKLTQLFSFITYRFDDNFCVFWRGRQIESVQWCSVIKHAAKRSTRILVTWRKRTISHPLSKALSALDGGNFLSDTTTSPSSTPDPELASNPDGSDQFSRERLSQGSTGGLKERHTSHRGRMSVINELLRTPGVSPDPMQDLLTRKPSSSPMSAQIYLQDFHALQWVALKCLGKEQEVEQSDIDGTIPKIKVPHRAAPSRKTHDKQVEAYLLESHTYLWNYKMFEIRNFYRKCASKSLNDVELALAGMMRGGLDEPNVLKYKERLVRTVKSIFLIFLPLEQKGTICAKLWGALHKNITGPMDGNVKELKRTVEVLTSTATRAIETQAQLSKDKGPNPMETNLPPEIVKAWYHLLICQLQWHPHTMEKSLKQAQKCQRQLNKAYSSIVKTFEGKKLIEMRAVLPAEFMIFLVRRALEGFTNGQPDLLESYWNYYAELETSAREEPSNRLHQSRMSCLLDEIHIIQYHMNTQQQIIERLRECFRPQSYKVETSSLRSRFHVKLIEECGSNNRLQLGSLSELRRKTRELSDMSQRHMQTNKDRQEGAIYVFTIVTIIFLPLSTISSIFGMNTYDVRNSQQGQWVFWASAIPVTVVVFVASLFGAGVLSLRSIWVWVGLKSGIVETYSPLPADSEGRTTARLRDRADEWDTL